MTLRPYQTDAADKTLEGFKNFQRQLGVAPTGSGKTVTFLEIARRFQPARTLILVHREELAAQALTRAKAEGFNATLEKAEHVGNQRADLVVASVQTMLGRKENWPANHFGLVVCDECHHVTADSWQEVVGYFHGAAKVLGVTATPDRTDRRSLGNYFENVAFEIDFVQLIKDGFLCPVSVRTVPLKLDLCGAKLDKGDYAAGDVEESLLPWLSEIADAIKLYAADRKTLIFLPLIRTSKIFAEILTRKGIETRHVDGTSEDRIEVAKWLATPGAKAVTNAMLWTEGFDCPSVDCIVPLRATKSRSLFCQMVGRGTRTAQDKKDLLLLDFLWQHEKHRLVVRAAHLLAKCDATAERMIERFDAKAGEETQDLLETFSDAEHAREAALRKELESKAKRKAKFVSLVDYLMRVGGPDILDYQPTMRWHEQPISDGQRNALQRFGIDPEIVTCKGQASAILDKLFSRAKLDLASPRQIEILRRFKQEKPEQWTRKAASEFLSRRIGAKL